MPLRLLHLNGMLLVCAAVTNNTAERSIQNLLPENNMELPNIETMKDLRDMQDLLRKEIEKPIVFYGSITSLARAMEIHPITLTRFFKGRNMSSRILYKIYKVCKSTPLL